MSSADVSRSGHVTRLDRLELRITCDEVGEDRDTKAIRPSDMPYGEVEVKTSWYNNAVFNEFD